MTFCDRTLPFHLHLKSAQDSVLLCEQILRDLPGKRLVFRGLWQRRPVLVKLFLDSRSARRHWKREKEGVEALEKASATVPQLLFDGQLTDGSFVLVFEFLPQAQTALEFWNTLGSEKCRLAFLQKIVELLGTLHEAGLAQEDLHLGNFLISDQKLYAIDGDAICIRNSGESLAIRASSENLALFFAQLNPEHDALMESVIQLYANQRSMDGIRLLEQVKLDLPKIRRRRRLKYVKKSYRSCSEFVRSKKTGQIAVARRDAQTEVLCQFLDDPDAFMRKGELLKGGNTSTVVRVKVDDCDWVVKRYNIKNLRHALSRCFRPTRAWLSWGNAHRLKISGIATPRAVAMVEKRIGPFRSKGYYVCDFISGVNAEAFFQSDSVTASVKGQVAERFVCLFRLFHQLHIRHGDCKATNFQIKDNQPWVLDLDAMHEYSSPEGFQKFFRRDRQRFLQNWKSLPPLMRWFDEHLPG